MSAFGQEHPSILRYKGTPEEKELGMGLFDVVMDGASRFGPERIQKEFVQGLAKTFSVLSWVCVLVLAPASAEAGDAASGPPAAITPDGGRYWGPLVGGV